MRTAKSVSDGSETLEGSGKELLRKPAGAATTALAQEAAVRPPASQSTVECADQAKKAVILYSWLRATEATTRWYKQSRKGTHPGAGFLSKFGPSF